jgi:hypothetical protein
MKHVHSTRSALAWLFTASLAACAADTGTPGADTGDNTSSTPSAEPSAPSASGPAPYTPGAAPAPTSQAAAPEIQLLGTVALPATTPVASVQISTLLSTGVQAVLKTVPVSVDGSFTAGVAGDGKLFVVDALGPNGQVVGSGLVAVGAGAKGSIKVGPITPHSCLIVDVLREILGCYQGESLDPDAHPSSGIAPLAVDVSLSIDAEVKKAVDVALGKGVSLDVIKDALAKGALAAHKARLETLIAAGLTVDVSALVEAQVDALAKAQLGADLKAGLDTALTAAGATAGDLHVRADTAATLALKGALEACAKGVPGLDGIIDASILASIEVEAEAAKNAVVGLLQAGNAPVATIDAAAQAGVKLVADVGNALTLGAAVDARKSFVATLSGSGLDLGLLHVLGDCFKVATDLCVGSGLGFGLALDAALSADVDLSAKVDLCEGTLELSGAVEVQKQLSFEAVIASLLGVCGGGGETLAEPSAPIPGAGGFSADLLAQILASAQLVARVTP